MRKQAFSSKGKLIVIESGSDGSGKQTQTMLLFERLKKEGFPVMKVSFPNYEYKSSVLVQMYLNGELGEDPQSVNPYAASTFYAVDRFVSYQTTWKDFYLHGGIVLADRYVTSNMIHQTIKLENPVERKKFLQWLYDLEYNKMELPIPNVVFFLDVPVDISYSLIQNRSNKSFHPKDIHESNSEYLRKCYQYACEIANEYRWKKIDCIRDQKMRSKEDIHEEIYQKLLPLLS